MQLCHVVSLAACVMMSVQWEIHHDTPSNLGAFIQPHPSQLGNRLTSWNLSLFRRGNYIETLAMFPKKKNRNNNEQTNHNETKAVFINYSISPFHLTKKTCLFPLHRGVFPCWDPSWQRAPSPPMLGPRRGKAAAPRGARSSFVKSWYHINV